MQSWGGFVGDRWRVGRGFESGARHEPEKKTPSKIVDFDFERENLHIRAKRRAELAITLVAA